LEKQVSMDSVKVIGLPFLVVDECQRDYAAWIIALFARRLVAKSLATRVYVAM
jgi:hypothetical protein